MAEAGPFSISTGLISGKVAFDEGGGLQSIYGSYPLMAKELKGKRQPVRAYLRQVGRLSLTEAVVKKGRSGEGAC
jgi:hypothetical protein